MSGELVHIEIPGGSETARSRAFWAALFGWQFDEIPVPSAEYLLTRNNEDQGAAISNFEPNKRGSGRTSRSTTSTPASSASPNFEARSTRRWLSQVPAGSRYVATRTETSSAYGRATPLLSRRSSIQH